MKILIIDNSVDITGANNSIVKSSTSIASSGIQFIFAYPFNSDCIKKTEALGFKCYPVNFIEIRKKIYNILFYLPCLLVNGYKISRIVKNEKVDIIHVNDIFNLVGLAAALFTKVKVVTHVRRMPETFPGVLYKFWTRLHIKFADKIIAVSEANKKALLYKSSKIIVIYNQPPLNEAEPAYKIQQQLNKKITAIYTASYIPGKGQDYAVEIINKAKNDFPDWQFTLKCYGSDYKLQNNINYKQSLIEKSNTYNIKESIILNGTTDKVEQLVKESDLVFNLSDSESFSRTTLEALFYGVPVIATDVGGTNEMVLDGITGTLVQKGDIDAMYLGLKKLISDDGYRISMSIKGYNYVRETFSVANTSYKLRDVYLSISNKS